MDVRSLACEMGAAEEEAAPGGEERIGGIGGHERRGITCPGKGGSSSPSSFFLGSCLLPRETERPTQVEETGAYGLVIENQPTGDIN